ncbi:alpha/beta hydrolase [Thermobifida halotolerans]|uniref:Alpha/beta hydrolase n=1 Tax=Thermobifida halotolerans TaxID=483545 RepID=A0A399FU51_9ACTN|nr:hypothetical protein [Thermobifida halotolerans]UOE18974.1 alpha/beta hydrolase [Thermobifida halotolerans]
MSAPDRPNQHTGTVAGVPYVALPPEGGTGAAPLIVVWHMVDAPRSAEEMAATLPLTGSGAWRVFVDLPLHGARTPDDVEAVMGEALTDPLLNLHVPIVRQAVREFPGVVSGLREELGATGPLGLVGGSLGGAVALTALAETAVPVTAVALVNPAVTARSLVAVAEREFGMGYPWTSEAEEAADRWDFVARAAELADRVSPSATLLVSGDRDHTEFRRDAALLRDALDAAFVTVPDLAHALVEESDAAVAPQSPYAKVVDTELAAWFDARL